MQSEGGLFGIASRVAAELPGAELTHPFGPEWDVWKVSGKVFCLLTDLRGDDIVTVKSDPVEARALQEEFAAISPGYHMNKKHWITLRDGVPEDVVAELLRESYRLVVAGLPRRLRRWIRRISGCCSGCFRSRRGVLAQTAKFTVQKQTSGKFRLALFQDPGPKTAVSFNPASVGREA
ncbi:MmcQ/YjbR family DNA-binding protein [Corynebacterium breve]|uniref:MmcQ/YjbR family DNA-binding protein n=1 Tax=Corynebacterium breve TaxID=3049799 RepID=A0ABY8VCJ8_9CORY|nr:MmcQ/YjbR family DNA-binding protein [Corynebacterium breve]WIM67389.1 MmcQ/YjbR family DNA-binding protein [Corynebacterium breve]